MKAADKLRTQVQYYSLLYSMMYGVPYILGITLRQISCFLTLNNHYNKHEVYEYQIFQRSTEKQIIFLHSNKVTMLFA